MAKPQYEPDFYLRGLYLDDPPNATWTPALGGMHLWIAAHCQNAYGLGYGDIIRQPRFAEAVDVLDNMFGLERYYTPHEDLRHYDAAFRVSLWLYYDAGGVGIGDDECNRPTRDPIEKLYRGGWWEIPPGYKPIGYDPNPWGQPKTYPTQPQYQYWAQAAGTASGSHIVPFGTPGNPYGPGIIFPNGEPGGSPTQPGGTEPGDTITTPIGNIPTTPSGLLTWAQANPIPAGVIGLVALRLLSKR